ncbi:MAG: N-acetyl-gamma-glutamyl-phosphate reductase [Tissierellaceae bacterium]|nr:N-acetyl-gamma-glutamyl-phosphate reductase [Tissierellaceae bacterium]
MNKVAVVGSTGYVGGELVRLLSQHPMVDVAVVTSNSYKGQAYEDVYPHFKKNIDLVCEDELKEDYDVIFLALPHSHSSKWVNRERLKNSKIIDLGADYRLSYDVYKNWYTVEHESKDLIDEAVYGLSEWQREKIKDASLIANPGCYVTASLLTLLPLLKENAVDKDNIIIDAKTGVTGAGRSLSLGTHYTEVNENVKAYNLYKHRHKPEIDEIILKLTDVETNVLFTPHLVPMNRGILATIYLDIKKGMTQEKVREVYEKYYSQEKFIRLLADGEYAQTRWVKGSNYCDISFQVNEDYNKLICVTAIDNILKGAAGQAVQNMNIAMGFKEELGLQMIPLFPV